MSPTLRVLWTLSPATAPRPLRHCAGCGATKPFHSSGKFRLNANGKRLDAWLIYRCIDCGTSWNRALFERRAVSEIGPELLGALQANDPAAASRFANDPAGLPRNAATSDPGVLVVRTVEPPVPDDPAAMAVTLSVPVAVAIRLDRLLAIELGLSRSELLRRVECGAIRFNGRPKRLLRRPPCDGFRFVVRLDPSDNCD